MLDVLSKEKRVKILLVEPDFDASEKYLEWLRDAGYSVLPVRNLQQAVYLLRAKLKVDLLILPDSSLPEIKNKNLNFDLLLKGCFQDAPMVVTMGQTRENDFHFASATRVVKNPVRKENLLHAIEEILPETHQSFK